MPKVITGIRRMFDEAKRKKFTGDTIVLTSHCWESVQEIKNRNKEICSHISAPGSMRCLWLDQSDLRAELFFMPWWEHNSSAMTNPYNVIITHVFKKSLTRQWKFLDWSNPREAAIPLMFYPAPLWGTYFIRTFIFPLWLANISFHFINARCDWAAVFVWLVHCMYFTEKWVKVKTAGSF